MKERERELLLTLRASSHVDTSPYASQTAFSPSSKDEYISFCKFFQFML